jgi:hypothetical protein
MLFNRGKVPLPLFAKECWFNPAYWLLLEVGVAFQPRSVRSAFEPNRRLLNTLIYENATFYPACRLAGQNPAAV